jgi:hypothetical protein
MTVKVTQFAQPRATPFNLWTDEFSVTPGRTLSIIQAEYYHVIHSTPSNLNTNTYTIGANNGLEFQGAGAATVVFAHWVPASLPGALHVSQFAEAVIRENGAGTYRGGLGLLVWGDHRNGGFNAGYELIYAVDSGLIGIQKFVNNVVTGLLSPLAVPADGSKVAFTATIDASGTTLEAFDDEVSLGSVLDPAPGNLILGLPSMFTRNCPAATSMEFNSLRMGILSKLGY